MKQNPKRTTAYIYAIRDPLTCRINYVGCSIKPQKRYSLKPKSRPEDYEQPVEHLIWDIYQSGVVPEIIILETTRYKSRLKREKFWIAKIGKTNSLVNINGLKRNSCFRRSFAKCNFFSGRYKNNMIKMSNKDGKCL